MLSFALASASSQQTAPPDDSVVAGPWGFLIFILLVGAIAFLGWSMIRQFRKVDEAKEQGVYDESREEERARLRSEHAAAAASTEQSGTAPAPGPDQG